MAYHIAVDSCTDMTAAMKKDEHITLGAPYTECWGR